MIDNVYGLMAIVSFICIVCISSYIAIPHDIRAIKRMMQHT